MNLKHPNCYGKMLPDCAHLNYNQPTEGKIFRVLLERIGVGRQTCQVSVKREDWAECTACPEYRTCYDLSMAQLALQAAVGLH